MAAGAWRHRRPNPSHLHGYLFSLPNVSRRPLAGIEDGLIPVLQRPGLSRQAHSPTRKLRDNLLEF